MATASACTATSSTIKRLVDEHLLGQSTSTLAGDVHGCDVAGISGWNVREVTDMDGIFRRESQHSDVGLIYKFNADLSAWDTSSVTNMRWMFKNCRSLKSDLSKWDTSKVEDFSEMFQANPITSDLGKWDVSSATDMWQMFVSAKEFNADLTSWNVRRVTRMTEMFSGAQSFNGDLSTWVLGPALTSMKSMFRGASAFSPDLSGWCIPPIVNHDAIFVGTPLASQPARQPNLDRTAQCPTVSTATVTSSTVSTATVTSSSATTATSSTDTIAAAIARVPTLTEVEKLIEQQLAALTQRLAATEAANVDLKLDIASLRERHSLSAESKVALESLLPGGLTPPSGAGCDRSRGEGCQAVLETDADGTGISFTSKGGTVSFETAECGKTDACTLIRAVQALLALYD